MHLNRAFGLLFTQSEVDFVIPDLSTDLPLALDPFLLYKSRDQHLRELHTRLLSIFNQGIQRFREGQREELDRLIDFPEVDEIGFGYSEGKIKGAGLGLLLNRLLADTLVASPGLQERGLRHVEEMQLVSIGVGADRVSDIAGNALKKFLIEYTQEQAALWGIPLVPGLPVAHVFDFDAWEWSDGYFDLPQNPVSGLPVILVPRRIVRQLPWINYGDYARTEFRAYLRPARQPRQSRLREPAKRTVVEVTRSKVELLDRYVARKEREADQAGPTLGVGAVSLDAEFDLGEQFVARLQALPSGFSAASAYQRLVYEIINYLFEPELTDGRMEEPTHLGTERRDIIYVNESERFFLEYIRENYGSMFVLFEIKNVQRIELDHVNQMAAYLGARLGMLGFIVTRHAAGRNVILKTYSIYNDTPSLPRKTVLIVTDDDLVRMIRLKQESKNPAQRLREICQAFQWALQ